MELIHAVGRPRDGLVVVTFEKANCTQVVETTFKKLGLLDAAKAYHPFVHKYRWDVYVRNAPPVTVRDLRTAKREGCHVLKFVRDPIDRFGSIYSRYKKHGFRCFRVGLSIDEFLDQLERLNICRFAPGAYADGHLTTQRFWNERHDMYSEIVNVERLRCPAFRLYLKALYGLEFDPDFCSFHWERTVYDFTRAQRRRILKVYNADRQYRFKPLALGHPPSNNGRD